MEVFVARQPIFNENEDVFAYELLYRSNQQNNFPNVNGDQATAEVIINSFLNIGIDELSNGRQCFINFTEKLLKLKLPTYFRPRDIVVEILETVEPSQELLDICKELKDLGYKIALDDYVFKEQNPYSYKLLKFADIIKVDFLFTPLEEREKVESLAKMLGLKLVAEKVETREDFEAAKSKGYHYFQGYFFSKPIIVSTHDVPTYFHSYYEVIHNLSMVEPSIDIIAGLIERDLSLSYKLLKLINSPAFRPKHKITNIRQAIVLLGLIEIQKWIYVLAVRESTLHKDEMSRETISICLTRAKMCEEIGQIMNQISPTTGYFLTGMFSMMDALMGIPMDEILRKLPLHEDICDALNGKANRIKEILDLVISIEKAKWDEISHRSQLLGLDEQELFNIYANSVSWTNKLLSKEEIGK
ncbi:EAL domain-containing protein [Cytobacillus spongiae]|uniref:EAL and HDOD domain-containing protein n=1 Tax=Cytobacillus spongiae TaxID=2901381 RepID=UPI001F45AA80|nr:EAL domain-containing protein [Cytobacillus spongiae]UII54421.1 EAL domain-containing protein [Cytobacillus spongiae]